MADTFLFAKNLICVCIDSKEDSDYHGRVFHQYSDGFISFDSITDMTVIIDRLYDEWDFPQDALDKRQFHNIKGSGGLAADNTKTKMDEIQKQNEVRNIQNKRGDIATFIVQTKFRQNATWQGVALCKETQDKIDFLSAMDLIRFIDGACR